MILLILAMLHAQCSIERGSVKYLKDPGAARIHWTPKATTIKALSSLPALVVTPAGRTTAEMQVYTVPGTVMLLRVESDGDYHVVLGDGGYTMIVEVPSPACVTNAHLPALAATRAFFLALPKAARVSVTGVLFFDFPHGQTGHATNYVELHPVTKAVKLGVAPRGVD